MQEEKRQRLASLARTVRSEAEKDLTFKPRGMNKLSLQLTSGYGDCLEEMKRREEARAAKQQEYKSKLANETRRQV